MTKKKLFRVSCVVDYASVDMTVQAESPEAAREAATTALEGGESLIDWAPDEGKGHVYIDSISRMTVIEDV